ncbi:helical backbone metal receptor [Marinicella sediminis]|uniref:Helical backbone metal receptor n=1 Tax=Marinicella sediminis TaxID=1792834 RepID=A0ABV7J851_9GAMM|nr:helical backbone metal receptor [Marinicella sediminis]
MKSSLLILLFHVMIVSADDTQVSCITLSPHLTELVYSAGGGDLLAGVSAYSDYPDEATELPIIGDAFRLDLEQIKLLNPSIIFYWHQGTAAQVVRQLSDMGFNMVRVDIRTLADIPQAIRKIANMLGTTPVPETDQFAEALTALKAQATGQKTALIQISDKPIYTVGRDHWMSEAISTCGLLNVYDSLDAPAVAITLESAVLHNPQVIVTTMPFDQNSSLASWTQVEAIRKQQVVELEADHFTRPTLRLLLAIRQLCKAIQTN